MKHIVLALTAAAMLVPIAQATNAPPANEHGLITHPTTCYGAPLLPAYPGMPIDMTPLAMGSTFWLNLDGTDLHFRVQSATITYDADPLHPVTYDYGKKVGLIDTMITCYGSFPGYSVVSQDVLIR